MQEAEDLGALGYTAGVRGVQNHLAGVSETAQLCAAVFQAAVDAPLFVTPARQPGFGWHQDAEEVFIIQVRGEKAWQFQMNTVHPWPIINSIPENQKHERKMKPRQQCRLTAGDWHYIPGGFWCRTTSDSWSMSLSVGVNAAAMDYFEFLRNQLTRSILGDSVFPQWIRMELHWRPKEPFIARLSSRFYRI